MSEKHTPGPWRLKFQRNGGYRFFKLLIDNPDGSYHDMGSFRGVDYMNDPSKATLANARLIAAAPDLLEACKAAERILEAVELTEPIDIEDAARISAAIAKAQGTTSDSKGA